MTPLTARTVDGPAIGAGTDEWRWNGVRIFDILRAKGDLVVTIDPDETVQGLLDQLAQFKVGALVVTGADGGVVGIVSERDVVRNLQATGASLLAQPVSSIMTSQVHTATPDDDLEDLATLMTERRFRHVPVLNDGRLAGIVTIGDVVKHRLEQLQAERDQLTAYISS
ncbi:MAG: CBS domain-containing protein [Kineosporiaceae bacterium]